MNKNQFLLTTKNWENEASSKRIGSFNLYLGVGLSYATVADENLEIHLLGDLYDWEHPQFTNGEILEDLLAHSKLGIESLIQNTNKYSGECIVIVVQGENIFLFNDACGQREVYYSNDYSSFGTQVKLIGFVCDIVEHTDVDAQQFYQSAYFKDNKLHAGSATHKKNVYHLLPNHFIKITDKKVKRILLPEVNNKLPIADVAKQATQMLKGYLQAISNRKSIVVGLTAGYDSRILFLASLGIKNCKYYVNKTTDMPEDHYDIRIAKKLATLYNKELIVIEKDWNKIEFSNINNEQYYIDSLDFPRFSNIATATDEDEIVVNGNISETARNYFGYHKSISPKVLSILNGTSNLKFAIKQYEVWLKNQDEFEKLGYHTMDLFYWEEKMGNWQSKARTELFALGRNLVTPYNSRVLLSLLLSTNRTDRDLTKNKLYNKIIAELSDHNKDVMNLPINPSRKTSIILLLKRLRLFNLGKALKLKFALMKK